MTASNYLPPVDQFLTLGECKYVKVEDWLNYPQKFSLGPEHIPDLIRVATSTEWDEEDWETNPAVWAPIHAWRALAQLKAEPAIEPLLTLLQRIDDEQDDWVAEEIPDVYGLIGVTAIPALVTYMADASHGLWARVATTTAIEKIGDFHPETRDQCVAALTEQLETFAKRDPELNAAIVSSLIKLKAVEAVPVIERAFAADAVELSWAGDWEDVQIELGLREKRDTPRPNYLMLDVNKLNNLKLRSSSGFERSSNGQSDRKAKERAKKKLAKESRKKNRKKRK